MKIDIDLDRMLELASTADLNRLHGIIHAKLAIVTADNEALARTLFAGYGVRNWLYAVRDLRAKTGLSLAASAAIVRRIRDETIETAK